MLRDEKFLFQKKKKKKGDHCLVKLVRVFISRGGVEVEEFGG